MTPDQVDYLIMGQVILAGAGQNPARAAGLAGGLPASLPSITINKVCLSGLNAIAMADQMIRAGEVEIVVAGGMESMTNAPHLLPKSREGFKFGDTKLVDSMAYDALYDQATQQAMGGLTEQINAEGVKLTREEQDQFAAESHQKAAVAWKNGVFDDEVVPVTIPQRRGDDLVVSADEGVRGDTTAESLGKLPPAFAKDGTITAGSASQISDGAAAVVVMSKAKAEELGLEWLAEIGAHGMVAGPDSSLQLQPANATQKALDKEGLTAADLDLVEFNEAFAAVGIESARAPGPRPRQGQRQRRRDRARSPGRHVRHPRGPAPRPRAEAPRRRRRCRRAVRWRWPGRRAHRQGALCLTSMSGTSSAVLGPARPGRSRAWSRSSRAARRSCARSWPRWRRTPATRTSSG